MNAEMLIAAKRVVLRFEREWVVTHLNLDLPVEVKVLKRLVAQAEVDMEREAMWYEYQRQNANREYNEMMLRGEE